MLSSDDPTLDDDAARAKPQNRCDGEKVVLVVLAGVELAGIGLLLTGQIETAGLDPDCVTAPGWPPWVPDNNPLSMTDRAFRVETAQNLELRDPANDPFEVTRGW